MTEQFHLTAEPTRDQYLLHHDGEPRERPFPSISRAMHYARSVAHGAGHVVLHSPSGQPIAEVSFVEQR